MDTTQTKIAEMLTENTGAHFLDSGGAYGRNFERNAKRDFLNEPACSTVVDHYENRGGNVECSIYGSISLFHFLSANLIYDPETDAQYQAVVALADKAWNDDRTEIDASEHYIKTLMETCEVGGIYGDGEPISGYTYNDDNCLDQNFTYKIFNIRDCDGDVPFGLSEDTDYVLLQTHNGCDARGGFSGEVLFELANEYGLLDYNQYTLEANPPETGKYSPENLELFKLKPLERWYIDIRHGYEECRENTELDLNTVEYSYDDADKGHGKIYIEDDKAYCPVYGTEIVAYTHFC
jgi:hypothetical protein